MQYLFRRKRKPTPDLFPLSTHFRTGAGTVLAAGAGGGLTGGWMRAARVRESLPARVPALFGGLVRAAKRSFPDGTRE
jgi:hypothetical protein